MDKHTSKKPQQHWPQMFHNCFFNEKEQRITEWCFIFMTTKHVSMRYALGSNNTVKRASNIFTPLLYVSTWSLLSYFYAVILNNSPHTYIHTYIQVYIYNIYIYIINFLWITCYELLKVITNYPQIYLSSIITLWLFIWLEVSSSHTWTSQSQW